MDQINPEQFSSNLEGFHTEVMKQVESSPEENRDDNLHKEIIHKVIGQKLGKDNSDETPVAPQSSDLDSTIKGQVDALVQEAVSEDLDKAIEKARKTDNPLVLDAFHDALVGELYDRLVSGGKLKNIR